MDNHALQQDASFSKILSIIDSAHSRALKAVNAELIQMYWDVGKYLSGLCADARF